ncbi:MAG TPA: helix-turn-helix domain-containing protein [Burkholderiaceae bacterium]
MDFTVRTAAELGPILKRLRASKGWTQHALGQRIGLSQERIAAIENHPERISLDQLLTVLMTFDAQVSISARRTAGRTGRQESW